jgi:hypothetical protein
MIDSPRQIKFYSRAIYLGLAISEVDANNTEDMIASNIKSSLHHAHSVASPFILDLLHAWRIPRLSAER